MVSPPEQLILSPVQVAQIVGHAEAEYPLEACGILGGREGRSAQVYPLPNVERSAIRYAADPEAQLQAMLAVEEQGWEILAIYHSHPASPAYPSATDLEMAYYPEALTLIISLADVEHPVLRAFRIEEGRIEEAPVRVDSVMVKDPVTVTPETRTLDAIAIMRERKVSCVPVVADGRLVGILTERDLIEVTARLLQEFLET